jgi:hypothetical protein
MRFRAVRMGHQDFGRTLAMLDRIERLGKRLHAPGIVDRIVRLRSELIDACAPRPSCMGGRP